MRTLSSNAEDMEIKDLVVEWNELLAVEKYSDALSMFPFSDEEYDWTPKLLKECINGYGVIGCDDETLQFMLEEYEVNEFKVTSILARDDKEEVVKKIDVDRENLYGLDPDYYVGMVHFNDVPLSTYLSDLTARFNIKKVGEKQITLEFLDVHVM